MGILRFPWKISSETPEPTIGILAFEVAGLMSKLVNLWHGLSDKEIAWLKEQISDSIGVKRFVSDDTDLLMELALEEMIENFGSLSKSVARLGKKCRDPTYHSLERFYEEPEKCDLHWFGWSYKGKKMDKKVKKMEKFVASTIQLSHEQDVLVELEQTLRRMLVNGAQFDRVKVLEFQQKVMWQRQEVKGLRNSSPWNRTHGYVVRIMARSLYTILERIKIVFGDSNDDKAKITERRNSDFLGSNRSLKHHRNGGGSFSGCVEIRGSNLIGGSMRLAPIRTSKYNNVYSKLYLFKSKSKSLNVRSNTLGFAALALRYANVIKVIEKFTSSPNLIGKEARDDLYEMLPSSIKNSLRSKLNNSSSFVYDPSLAARWNLALLQILEWLGPLAHDTIRWHSERNIEKNNEFSRTNVLLVMTLYHADRARIEAAITELLLGLNYMCRISGLDGLAAMTTMIREQPL